MTDERPATPRERYLAEVTGDGARQPTDAEGYFADRLRDPAYAAGYEEARARLRGIPDHHKVKGLMVEFEFDPEVGSWHFHVDAPPITGGGQVTLEEAKQTAAEAIDFAREEWTEA